jgi:nucleoside diphosphate-linked moiety X motif protein 19
MGTKLADLAELAGFSFKTTKFWQVKVMDPNSPWLASTGIPGKDELPPPPKYTPKPWKEAASLIVAARVESPDKTSSGESSSASSFSGIQKVLPIDDCDYRLLMAKRSGKSSYLANAFVFPGGYVELADFSTKWWAVFEAAGMSRTELSAFGSDIKGTRPPIFTEAGVLMQEEYLSSDILPSTVALRITAIRETFEETGILLLNRAPSRRDSKTSAFQTENDFAKIDMKAWQQKIHDNPVCFADFCLEIGLCPDIWSLHEWWNWLTPNALGHKRFDTMFYVCCLDFLPKAFSDDNEVSKLEWVSPLEMLEEHIQKRAVLAPPQVYELSRISNFNSLGQLKEFAAKREKQGIERWCANITGLKDGALLTLPGDEFFEKPPEVNSKYLPTLEEMRIRSKNLNRIELRAPTMIAVSNVKLDFGHVTPIAYPAVHTSLQSNL